MIEKTFESEAGPALTIRIDVKAVMGRTADMPEEMWWIMTWADLPNFVRSPQFSLHLRRGFQWALDHRHEVLA